MSSLFGFKLSIRFTLFSIFVIATCITAGVAIMLQYYFATEYASKSALNQFHMSAKYTGDYLAAIDHRATKLTELLAADSQRNLDNENLNVMAKAMERNPLYHSIFIGHQSGHFTQLINLDATSITRKRFNAQQTDKWLKIEIFPQRGEVPTRQLTFLNEQLNATYTSEAPHVFDPTVRPWFIGANTHQVYKSAPYQFQSLDAPGLTYSKKLTNSDAILGVDIALASLSAYLAKNNMAIESQLYLYQPTGEVIATNQLQNVTDEHVLTPKKMTLSRDEKKLIANMPVLQISNSKDWSPIDFAISGQPMGYAVDKINLIAEMTGIKIEFINGFTWPELVQRYKDKKLGALQAVYQTPENLAMGTVSAPFMDMPFATITRAEQPIITSLTEMTGQTLAIAKGWSIIAPLKQRYPSITFLEVNTIRDVFAAVKQGKANAGLDSHLSLVQTASQFFIDGVNINAPLFFGDALFPSSLHLLVQNEWQPLLPIINRALDKITPVQERYLKQKWLSEINKSQHSQNTFAVPHKTLIDAIDNPTLHNSLIKANMDGQSVYLFISPVKVNDKQQSYFAIITPSELVYGDTLEEVTLSIIITALCLLCLLPLSYVFSAPIVQPIHKLMAQNKKIQQRKFDEVNVEPCPIKELDQLGHSLNDMANAIKTHEQQQANLLESFIELIAQAIDDKSPYTAGHCKRVPEIGMLLAQAANKSEQGIFTNFKLQTKEQIREFRMAAWLHDCGKITTPEHIVDKATKLETIYNRIHEIRMRFEVLWRDALLEYQQHIQLNPESQTFYKTELKRKQLKLHDDFGFIAECNLGGEYLSEDKVKRLEELAAITWERHFDDTLGLSELELEYKSKNKRPLPCVEMLLSDKPEHKRQRLHPHEHADKFGIQMDIPTLLADKGELYNLSISRGTLTPEDRFRINEHMISTIKMLDSLPFPDDLANVPRWASTHHETLIGTGYPRKLHKEDLSIPERILVVADIFEALTASDRPYKKAKSLSESLKIMSYMVKDQHIDADIFELFLTSGVYLEYAKQHLEPTQIDQVDITLLLDDVKVA
jgi:HD-GYP domain-containing protein (c-di-GMP phosphodiesterase class II)/ABC-type amino acid transport substrate-binding protein